LAVVFLAEPPVINGIPDPNLLRLPGRNFTDVDIIRTREKPAEVHYRLAYGTDFLYIYVEALGDKLTYNDRAYQKGDGFHMVVARAMAGNPPSNEFYAVACSAVDRPPAT